MYDVKKSVLIFLMCADISVFWMVLHDCTPCKYTVTVAVFELRSRREERSNNVITHLCRVQYYHHHLHHRASVIAVCLQSLPHSQPEGHVASCPEVCLICPFMRSVYDDCCDSTRYDTGIGPLHFHWSDIWPFAHISRIDRFLSKVRRNMVG